MLKVILIMTSETNNLASWISEVFSQYSASLSNTAVAKEKKRFEFVFPVFTVWRGIVMIIVLRDPSLPLLSQSLLFSDSAWGPFLLERREVQGKAGWHKKSKNRSFLQI